jgi:membrane-associated phospholipid phosphatase
LLPGFVWIYLLAFVFWGVSYILVAQRGKDMFYRFTATDLTVHLLCFLIFVILPTTNVRPEITGNSLSERMLRLIYKLDGGSEPFNLFPSIHCYVSWLSYRGLKGAKEIPAWYQKGALVMALLVIISTQVLKQHYLIDAVAAVTMVEVAWRFYARGNHYVVFKNFFEKLYNRKNRTVWEKLRE